MDPCVLGPAHCEQIWVSKLCIPDYSWASTTWNEGMVAQSWTSPLFQRFLFLASETLSLFLCGSVLSKMLGLFEILLAHSRASRKSPPPHIRGFVWKSCGPLTDFVSLRVTGLSIFSFLDSEMKTLDLVLFKITSKPKILQLHLLHHFCLSHISCKEYFCFSRFTYVNCIFDK